jgi:hypothetical protein
MNRAKKGSSGGAACKSGLGVGLGGGGGGEDDIPDELRCKRSDGKQWRCNARALESKTLCEKHYSQAKKRAAGTSAGSSPKKKSKLGGAAGSAHHGKEGSSFHSDHPKGRPLLLLEAEPRSKLSSKAHGGHRQAGEVKHAGSAAKAGRPSHFPNGSSSKDLVRSQTAFPHVSPFSVSSQILGLSC